jgi:hypothetical protein
MIGVANTNFDPGGLVDADMDTFATALYVKIDGNYSGPGGEPDLTLKQLA